MFAPEVSYQPLLHNPFPQFSRVAVAPFFNQSDEPTVNGRKFALAYFAELQDIRGFEVVPLGVVEETMIRHAVDLSSPGEARRLAQLLGVDAVVVGSVTDYTPYYPPRCGMRIEWYAANPGFHEIPAGYGLPWGTPQEEYIPEDLVFEAEMALARAQMATQSPVCPNEPAHLVPPPQMVPPKYAQPIPTDVDNEQHMDSEDEAEMADEDEMEMETDDAPKPMADQPKLDPFEESPGGELPPVDPPTAEPEALPAPTTDGSAEDTQPAIDNLARRRRQDFKVRRANSQAPIDSDASDAASEGPTTGASGAGGAFAPGGMLPPDWPDARGFTPPGPSPVRPPCTPHHGPVMTHTRIYRGHDPDFTAALASYVSFRDDARFGGWQSYLERSDDFIRFCAHLHLAEMLTARGGGSETRVVRRWSQSR